MRAVIAIDGDLLVPGKPMMGIQGQKEEISRVIACLGEMLKDLPEVVIIHGNAPQVGFMLLRAEVASHVIHPLPLDVCGSDTQGATGYMLQVALRNWFNQQSISKEVTALVTQVVVDPAQVSDSIPTKGVGPFYDWEKAQLYANTRGWKFVLTQGYGYRREVPSLVPQRILEVNAIRSLMEQGMIVICAGGGGTPVNMDGKGNMVGVEAVVDKALTAGLLASELKADSMVFLSVWGKVEQTLQLNLSGSQHRIRFGELDRMIEQTQGVNEDLYIKLSSSQKFLQQGGQRVLIAPPEQVGKTLEDSGGLLLTL